MIIALTGGTGFVGRRFIDQAVASGHVVRALTRKPQPARTNVSWIGGTLETPGALAEGADVVVHIAGVVNAPTREGFAQGNIAGTQSIIAAAKAAGVRRFVHVSSLAAREPDLSSYGWSKAGAERAVQDSGLDWTMVRPPAVYGPGDMEMRDMFRMAKMGIALLPPPGKLSVIHVDDLSRLLLVLAESGQDRMIFEADDGREGGWTHDEFARAIGTALHQKVLPMALPRPLLSLAAKADGLLRGDKAKLTSDRVAYFCHPDWRIDPAKRPPADLWEAAIPTPAGLAQTAAWYAAQRLL